MTELQVYQAKSQELELKLKQMEIHHRNELDALRMKVRSASSTNDKRSDAWCFRAKKACWSLPLKRAKSAISKQKR